MRESMRGSMRWTDLYFIFFRMSLFRTSVSTSCFQAVRVVTRGRLSHLISFGDAPTSLSRAAIFSLWIISAHWSRDESAC